MSDWIPLSTLVDLGQSARELEELNRETPIRMLGEFCVDYTVAMLRGRTDPTEIPRDFVLNASFNLENSTVTAHTDYRAQDGAMNYEMYSFVRFSLSDFIQAGRCRRSSTRGRPPKHDWDLIISVALEEMDGWEGSQNKFISYLRQRLVAEEYEGDLPDESTLKRKLATAFNSRPRAGA